MDAKRSLVGVLVGAVVLYVTAYLIFDLAFGNFYSANAGSATGVDRDSQLVWAVIVGSLAYGGLLTYVIAHRTGTVSIGAGAQIGAIVGFLLWCTADFTLYGLTNISNLTLTVVDPLLEIVHGAIGGAGIAWVLGMMARPARKSA